MDILRIVNGICVLKRVLFSLDSEILFNLLADMLLIWNDLRCTASTSSTVYSLSTLSIISIWSSHTICSHSFSSICSTARLLILLSITSSISSLILIFTKWGTNSTWSCISLGRCWHRVHFICSILGWESIIELWLLLVLFILLHLI